MVKSSLLTLRLLRNISRQTIPHPHPALPSRVALGELIVSVSPPLIYQFFHQSLIETSHSCPASGPTAALQLVTDY